MDATLKLSDGAFAVPRRLFTGRKRRPESPNATNSTQFFSADEFAAFSVRGDAHESRLYGDLETRRRTIVTSNVASSKRKSSSAMKVKRETKHLVHLLVEAIETDRIQRPEKMSEFDNGRRRVSGFSVAEHEQYLMLQHKLFLAQQRGLPEVLALSKDEAKQWEQMKSEVKNEQMTFCRMMARGLAAEAAVNEAHVPQFVASWLVSGQPLRTSLGEDGGLMLEVVSPRQAISADPQAEKLMEQYDCDIAVSSSTLVTLFDSDTSAHFAQVVESIAEGSTGGRTAYHIWQLEDKRILVRSTTQASMSTSSRSPPGTAGGPASESDKKAAHEQLHAVPLSVFVKPDYHLLGIEEQLTTSERCRFWLHSWLRGGSTVLVARVNPKKEVVTSWTTYSPASLIYGDKQSLPLECFDPASKFQWLSTLFTALGDVPVGNYVLRPQDAVGPSTFGKRRDGVEVLMATTEPGLETPVVDLYSFMPKTNAPDEGQAAALLPSDPACSVLPAWNLRDRIPYTFQTGTYCLPFFLEGMCPNISKGESCDHIHLRLPKQHAGSKSSVKTKRWKFENYTKVLKKATRTNFEVLSRPTRVTLNYAFCGEEKAPPSDPSTASLYAQAHCPKPPGQCLLPHFTLHQILERLANELLRKGRGKRRAQKNNNRQQHKPLGW
uniref:Little elongation complex subunit 2 C-terminal domain-containing protein n=1 Tax=Phytophthora ramorum TaxID=164328 RepID=H3GEH9_PHYRM